MRRVHHHRFETDVSAVDVEAWVNNDAPAESFETVEVTAHNRVTARHVGTAHIPRVHAAAVAAAIAAMANPDAVRLEAEHAEAVAERDRLREEVHALERPHKCVASGLTVASCRDSDLCDCFGGQTPMQRVMDAERAALAAEERARTAEAAARWQDAALAAVLAVCAEVEADDRRSLDMFGQHQHGAVVVVAEKVRAAIASAPRRESVG